MEERFDVMKSAPEGIKGMYALEQYLHGCGLGASLLHLVKMRASQLNGCAFCLDMHSKDLRAIGETEQRIYTLDAWRECPWYSDRERAALAWTEAVTLITNGHVPDAVYEQAHKQFTDKELSDLTLDIAAINVWNRISIASRKTPGTYQVPAKAAATK